MTNPSNSYALSKSAQVPLIGLDDFSAAGQPFRWPQKYETLGVHVSATTYTEVVNVLIQAANERRPAIVDFMPVSVLIEAARNPIFRTRLNSFDLVCPDGQPVRWCLNYFHKAGLRETVCGTTATIRLCQAAARENIGVYLCGSTPGTLRRLQANLLSLIPALRIVGADSPPYSPLSTEERDAMARRINDSGAGFVFVGIGSPKQENLVWEQKSKINAVQLCIGAAFDFIAGTKRRAPEWMQRIGLEWAYRLCTEPVRLGKRYALGNARFIALVVGELLRSENQRVVDPYPSSSTPRDL
jgi:N-acetylglucosaminyldiphosphoundecaprenol N-acetyl-beta-D-mannosaminyltransferase